MLKDIENLNYRLRIAFLIPVVLVEVPGQNVSTSETFQNFEEQFVPFKVFQKLGLLGGSVT